MVPNDWKLDRIDAIADISSGGTPSRDNAAYWGGEIPWVTTAEVRFNRIHETEQTITKSGLTNSSAKLLAPGTILVAMYGQGKTRGQVALLEIEATTNQACAAICLRPGYSKEFYFQYLQNEYQRIRNLSNSGGQDNLSGAIVKSIKVAVPPFKEQGRVAEILSSWDKAIGVSKKLIQNSKAQKKALMQQLLTGKKRLPGFSDNWQRKRFTEIFERITEKNSIGNDNVLTISGKHGLVNQREYFNKRVASANLATYTLLQRGDFAYNKSYSSGYPYGAIKPLDRYEAGVVSSLYLCFRLTDNKTHCHSYFRHYFEGGFFNREIYAIAQEGARNHGLLNVSSTDFFGSHVLIPSPEEEFAVAAVIDTAESHLTNLTNQLMALQRQKRSLMQQLLTGKVRVKV